MFVIQRVLEVSGRLTLLDQRRVIRPHPAFRLFATANTVGLGDTSGLYHGTQQINQGQMDRWSIVTTLNYLPHDKEVDIVLSKATHYRDAGGAGHREQDGARRRPHPQRLHQRRPLDRDEPAHGDHLGRERRDLQRHRLRLPASPSSTSATSWSAPLVAEFYQRSFGKELPESAVNVALS